MALLFSRLVTKQLQGSMKDSLMRNHSLYFVLRHRLVHFPNQFQKFQKGYRVMVRVSLLGLVLVSTDSIVQICVHLQILHILFFVCHSPQLHNFKVFLFLIVLNRYFFLH